MSSDNVFENITFDLPKNQSNVIKVIGVGGGGSNAINYMFKQGIKGVDFVVCNTDSQALENSPVPIKIQLGVSLTEGLGAGANPEIGKDAALESMNDIKAMLSTNTKMVFITAGMGGGTGTGAAPIIAKMAKELDILTVGIVTVPFQFEGKTRLEQAQQGVENLRKNVDSLIVINNNKLREVYGNLGFKSGFSKADEVLATAARGIAEVITHHYTQNIDLRDARTVLSNSGSAIMGSAIAEGPNRAHEAISQALDSPLLNDNKITGAKNVLLLIVSGTEEITIDEIGEINDYIQSEAGHSANIIMGVGEDESLGKAISATVIATGFNVEQQNEIVNTESKKIIHRLEDEQTVEQVLVSKENAPSGRIIFDEEPANEEDEPSHSAASLTNTPVIVHNLFDETEEDPIIETPSPAVEQELPLDIPQPKGQDEKKEEAVPFSGYIPTTELLRQIPLVYEEVLAGSSEPISSEKIQEQEVNDFVIVDRTEKKEEPKKEQEPAEPMLVFDLPIKQEEKKPALEEIEVRDSIEVFPVTEISDQGEIRYSLDDYQQMEDMLMNSKPQQDLIQEEEVQDESIAFEKKTLDSSSENRTSDEEDADPVNASIAELLKKRTEERKAKMKAFNYKFSNLQDNRIDELEKQPAYKRMGIDLNDSLGEATTLSKTTLSIDENDEIVLRNNNSFLHDNVD